MSSSAGEHIEPRRPSRLWRSRWAAIGAAIAVTLGAGGVGLVSASTPDPASVVVTIDPCRNTDTRPASQKGPIGAPVGQGESGQITVQITGTNGDCTIPTSATGIIATVTVVNANTDAVSPGLTQSFMTVYPNGSSKPTASNLNYVDGQAPTPTSVAVDIGTGGKIVVFNHAGTVDVLIDIVAYTIGHDHDDEYSALGHDHDGEYFMETTSAGLNCPGSTNPTSTFQKNRDILTFTKQSDDSVVVARFSGRLYANSLAGANAAQFELRIDDVAATEGFGRALVRSGEVGAEGVEAAINATFTGLSAGTHTVSMWVRATNSGSGTFAGIDPGCFSSANITVEEHGNG